MASTLSYKMQRQRLQKAIVFFLTALYVVFHYQVNQYM